jgi:FlaG/FlaF family flagellin (archaellin)
MHSTHEVSNRGFLHWEPKSVIDNLSRDSLCLMDPRRVRARQAVQPVVASIILIATTLVLALVVGAYTFGLFGSNVKIATVTSANLFGGTVEPPASSSPCNNTEAHVSLSVSNAGKATELSAFTLTGASLDGESLSAYFVNASSSSSTCTQGILGCLPLGLGQGQTRSCLLISSNSASMPVVSGGAVSSFVLFFRNSSILAGGEPTNLVSGELFSYLINLADGQSVSGTLTTQ